MCLLKCKLIKNKTRTNVCDWCPPSQGWVKFNVNGVVNEDVARCGGVLRDEDGVARTLYSGLIATKELDSTEVQAIKNALDMYIGMGWKTKGPLIIEFGSNVVLKWLMNKVLSPWMLRILFTDIDKSINRLVMSHFQWLSSMETKWLQLWPFLGLNVLICLKLGSEICYIIRSRGLMIGCVASCVFKKFVILDRNDVVFPTDSY